jgi:hypothetical protein
MREFADCLQKSLAAQRAEAPAAATPGAPEAAGTPPPTPRATPAAAPPKAKPISGIRLFFGALLDRIRRLFRRR